MPLFTPEFALLLDACSLLLEAGRTTRFEQRLAQPFDSQRACDLAEHHGVVPQLVESIKAIASPLPSDAQKLRDLAAAAQTLNIQRSLWFTSGMHRIVRAFNQRGIPLLAYKGPALAQTLYGDVARRQFSDLDFLVAPKHVPQAKQALRELGYTPDLRLPEWQEKAYIREGYEFAFNHERGRNLLELHWQILPRFYAVSFDVDRLFAKSTEISIAGLPARTLSIQDSLLVLCVHAAKHQWSRLSMLRDVAEMAKHEEIDWPKLHATATSMGIARIVATSFLLANRLLEAPLPPFPVPNFSGEKSLSQTIRFLVSGTDSEIDSPKYFRSWLGLRERWRDRIAFLWRLAITPGIGEWQAVRLPESLAHFYFLARVWRLLGKAWNQIGLPRKK